MELSDIQMLSFYVAFKTTLLQKLLLQWDRPSQKQGEWAAIEKECCPGTFPHSLAELHAVCGFPLVSTGHKSLIRLHSPSVYPDLSYLLPQEYIWHCHPSKSLLRLNHENYFHFLSSPWGGLRGEGTNSMQAVQIQQIPFSKRGQLYPFGICSELASFLDAHVWSWGPANWRHWLNANPKLFSSLCWLWFTTE